jgi:hypothetical protein
MLPGQFGNLPKIGCILPWYIYGDLLIIMQTTKLLHSLAGGCVFPRPATANRSSDVGHFYFQPN